MMDESLRLEGSPISAVINVATLPTNGRVVTVEPGPDELSALTEEMGVEAVHSLRADVSVKRWQRDGVRLSGPVKAYLTQSCVVSLEPVDEHVEADIDAVFVPDGSKLAKRYEAGAPNDLLIDPDGDDAPEHFTPPDLDIGAVVHEFLSLSMNPYPRAPGIETDAGNMSSKGSGDDATNEKPNPFAALAALKNPSSEDT